MALQISQPGRSFVTVPTVGGKCQTCFMDACYICRRCASFYCSRVCQALNWPIHKNTCNQMPELDLFHTINASNNRTPPPTVGNNQNGYGGKNNYQPKQQQSNNNNNRMIKPLNDGGHKSPQDVGLTNGNGDVPEKKMEFIEKIVPPTKLEFKPINIYEVPFPKDKTPVCITWASDQRNDLVFIRPADSNSDKKYTEILNDVCLYAETARPLTELPHKGDVILASYQDAEGGVEGDEQFYRALVRDVKDNEHITVSFLEFGNSEEKRLSELRDLRPDLKTLPRLTLPCRLRDVNFDTYSPKAREFSEDLGNLVTPLEIRYDGEYQKQTTYVELFISKTKESVNKRLNSIFNVNVPGIDDPIAMVFVS